MKKQSKLKGVLAMLLFVGLGLGATVALADSKQDKGERAQRHEARMVERLNDVLDDIDATDAQRGVVFSELGKLRPEAQKLRVLKKAHRQELLAQALSPAPNIDRVHKIIEESSTMTLAMAHKAVDRMLVIHASLSSAQRDELAKQWDMPAREFKGSWFIDRGLDRALNRIDATDAQRKRAEASKESMVKDAGALMKSLEPMRAQVLTQWRAQKPDAKIIHTTLDKAALLITQFAHDGADEVIGFSSTLNKEQRERIQAQVEKMKARHQRRAE